MTSQTASSASYQIPSSRSRKSDNGVAIGYAKFYTRSHDAVIRVYDEAGNVIEMHEHEGDFKDW
jgi:hypothetical protein